MTKNVAKKRSLGLHTYGQKLNAAIISGDRNRHAWLDPATVHKLRICLATHLLQAWTGIRTIWQPLDQINFGTIMIYAHLGKIDMELDSPLVHPAT